MSYFHYVRTKHILHVRILTPSKNEDFSLLHLVLTGFGVHPNSNTIDTRITQLGPYANHLLHLVPKAPTLRPRLIAAAAMAVVVVVVVVLVVVVVAVAVVATTVVYYSMTQVTDSSTCPTCLALSTR
jgi:hypothetical protein